MTESDGGTTAGDGHGRGDAPAVQDPRAVRGSTLLLFGRATGVILSLVAQVILVRALDKADYGAFAYALAVVSLGSSIAVLGMDKAMSRFLPMYDERGDAGRALGGLALGVALAGIVSVVVIAGVLILLRPLAPEVDPLALSLLAILVLLVPVQAYDALLTAVFAVLASPKAIFFRRHLMAPGLQLLVLAIAVPAGLGVMAIAVGYLVAGLVGVVVYGLLLVRLTRTRWGHARRSISIPAREVLGFSLPLLSSDLVFVLRGSLVVVMLEWFGSTTDVAAFRAVLPQARLTLIVLTSFGYLFLPAAARLVERRDAEELGRLFWHGMAWVALFAFPAFAASFALAEPVSVLLYGASYADSAPVLATLALGFFVSAVLGLSGLVLRARGRVRAIVAVDLVTAGISIASYVVLIPPLGALGAAIGTAGTLILQAVAYLVVALRAGLAPPTRRQLLLYPALAVASIALLAVQVALAPPIWVSLPLVAIVSLGAVWAGRRQLDLQGTFPELGRLPVLGPLLIPVGDRRAAR